MHMKSVTVKLPDPYQKRKHSYDFKSKYIEVSHS